ncbi:TPA: hypothetical protein LA462_000280 [Clostridium botulinum]|nr:hypothetical protein [Clostridium botulinum]
MLKSISLELMKLAKEFDEFCYMYDTYGYCGEIGDDKKDRQRNINSIYNGFIEKDFDPFLEQLKNIIDNENEEDNDDDIKKAKELFLRISKLNDIEYNVMMILDQVAMTVKKKLRFKFENECVNDLIQSFHGDMDNIIEYLSNTYEVCLM